MIQIVQPSYQLIKESLGVYAKAICDALYGELDPYTKYRDNTGLLATHPDSAATKKLSKALDDVTALYVKEGYIFGKTVIDEKGVKFEPSIYIPPTK